MYSLQELTGKIQQIFAETDFNDKPEGLYAPISYTLSLGGKRIRPVLLLAATDLFGGCIHEAIDAAIGIEIFHNFTLLHDDLMDRSPLRRGQTTVYRKWNENTAILSGDAMNTMAWNYFLKQPLCNHSEILSTFAQTSIEVCEGQQYDMDFESRNDVTIDEYMKMIRLKTAVLLAGALKIGALIADASPDDTERIYQFGIALGLAFQLRDDILDSFGDTSTFGKKTGTDIVDNKKTYLLLHALEKANPSQRQRLQTMFSTTTDDNEAKINEVIGIYNELNIKEDTQQYINQLHNQAAMAIDAITRPDEYKQTLRDVAASLLNRNI